MGGKKTVDKSREWEKGRRDKLNHGFLELSKVLPDHDPSINLSKMEILTKAADYIKHLQEQNQDIINNGKETFMDFETERLRKRVAQLLVKTKLLVDALRNAGVPIPSNKKSKRGGAKKPNLIPLISQSAGLKTVNISPIKDFSVKEKTPNTVFDVLRTTKEPLKEVNSTLSSVSVPEDVATMTKPRCSTLKQGEPVKGEVCCLLPPAAAPPPNIAIGPPLATGVPTFTLLDRSSFASLGPGTLIIADGRVVSVPPAIPQIVVKPQPALILLPKSSSSKKEKKVFPKPDVTKTTFTNKAPIPAIKHFNFEMRSKRKFAVPNSRISQKQKMVRKKETLKSTVISVESNSPNKTAIAKEPHISDNCDVNKQSVDIKEKEIVNSNVPITSDPMETNSVENDNLSTEIITHSVDVCENGEETNCPLQNNSEVVSENCRETEEPEGVGAQTNSDLAVISESSSPELNCRKSNYPHGLNGETTQNTSENQSSTQAIKDMEITEKEAYLTHNSNPITTAISTLVNCDNIDHSVNPQFLEVDPNLDVDPSKHEFMVKEKSPNKCNGSSGPLGECNILSNMNQEQTLCNDVQNCHTGYMNVSPRMNNENIDKEINDKDDTYKGNNMVCKYTIDSLFKNPSLDGSVDVNKNLSGVKGNSQHCKNVLKEAENVNFSGDVVSMQREDGMVNTSNHVFQQDQGYENREANGLTSISIDSALREVNLTPSSCAVIQSELNSSIKNNCQVNKDSPNKDYSPNESVAYKNDSLLLPSDLMKSKELERNAFMPLLDDMRLTTDFSNDLFSSFQVPPGGQHAESMSPTAAFLLAFPLVSTSKTSENLAEADNPEHQSSTPTTILQIGNIDPPNPEMFTSQLDPLRPSKDDHQKEFDRYASYESAMYDSSIQSMDTQKRKTPPAYMNQCTDKSCKRNGDNRKRPRNNMDPQSSQPYTYPIFSNNDYSSSQYPISEPKSDSSQNVPPWGANVNQVDFPQQTVQKDACTTMKSKVLERKKPEKVQQKNANYSYSQHGTQTVEYYNLKPDRKKQKNAKPPVNWMAPPEPKNVFLEPQMEIYNNHKEQEGNNVPVNTVQGNSQNNYNNIQNLEVPFDNISYSDFNNKKATNNFSWSPSKSLLTPLDNHNFVIPSTLPTLVGDLALGTSTPSEPFKSFQEKQIFDQNKKDKSLMDNVKKRPDFGSKTSQVNNTFLSVSQLVDPKNQKQVKLPEVKQQNPKRNEKQDKYVMTCNYMNRRDQPDPNCMYSGQRSNSYTNNNQWSEKQKQQYKGGSYSAESLIAVNQDHEPFQFNSYQGNYFNGEFTETTQTPSQPQYQNYFNSQNHFPTFLGDEYQHGTEYNQRNKVKQKQKEAYHNAQHFNQAYPNCVKTSCSPYVSQHTNATSTLTNFNLSTIFPEMNDQRVVPPSQPTHLNSNFPPLPAAHNYPQI